MSPVGQRVYTANGRRAHYSKQGRETYCYRVVVPLEVQSEKRQNMLRQASVCGVCEKREEAGG